MYYGNFHTARYFAYSVFGSSTYSGFLAGSIWDISHWSFGFSMVVQPDVGRAPSARQIWKKMEDPAFGTTFGGALWAMKSLSE